MDNSKKQIGKKNVHDAKSNNLPNLRVTKNLDTTVITSSMFTFKNELFHCSVGLFARSKVGGYKMAVVYIGPHGTKGDGHLFKIIIDNNPQSKRVKKSKVLIIISSIFILKSKHVTPLSPKPLFELLRRK